MGEEQGRPEVEGTFRPIRRLPCFEGFAFLFVGIPGEGPAGGIRTCIRGSLSPLPWSHQVPGLDRGMGEGRRERVRCMCMERVTRKLTIPYTE